MEINWALKSALVRRFGSQIEAARQMGIRENRLSYIVRGHTKPTSREWEKLEAALGKPLAHRLVKQHGPVVQGRRKKGDNPMDIEDEPRLCKQVVNRLDKEIDHVMANIHELPNYLHNNGWDCTVTVKLSKGRVTDVKFVESADLPSGPYNIETIDFNRSGTVTIELCFGNVVNTKFTAEGGNANEP